MGVAWRLVLKTMFYNSVLIVLYYLSVIYLLAAYLKIFNAYAIFRINDWNRGIIAWPYITYRVSLIWRDETNTLLSLPKKVIARPQAIGRFQTLFPKKVKFANFEKFILSCDSASRNSSVLKFWPIFALCGRKYCVGGSKSRHRALFWCWIVW